MTDSAGSSVPRRQLGRLLKEARETARIAIPAAALEIEVGRSKIYRIEAGEAPLKKVEVLALARLYKVSDKMTEVLVGLAAETKAQGWWASYAGMLPTWFELYVSLEAAASEMRLYAPTVIPGLLQTEAYAAAVSRATPGNTEQRVAQLVSLRMQRQHLLARRVPRPPALDVILDESVLRRPIADLAAMGAQILHLAEKPATPGIHVRILMLSTGPHVASTSGSFNILDFRAEQGRPAEPTTVYCEGMTGALYLDKPAEVEAYEGIWTALDDLALGADESQDMMRTLAKEYSDA